MDMFSVLAEPTRRDILELLVKRGKLPASEIYAQFAVSPPAISQHLKVLREAKLVDMEKHAQQHIYSVNPAPMNEMEQWIKQMRQMWHKRFDALDNVLREEKKKMEGGE